MELPTVVGNRIVGADGADTRFVSLEDPRAVEYALGQLDQIKECIANVLKILAFHRQDVGQVVHDLETWIDEVEVYIPD